MYFRSNQEQIIVKQSDFRLFIEMISWIANIKKLVDFETFDAFKRVG